MQPLLGNQPLGGFTEIGNPTCFISVSDSVTLSESLTIKTKSYVNATDSVTVTDGSTQYITMLYITVSDNVNVTEEIDISSPLLSVSVSDGLTALSDVLPHNCVWGSLSGLCNSTAADSYWSNSFCTLDANAPYPSFWLSQSGLPAWWSINLGTARTISSYSITGFQGAELDKTRTLTEWEFQGSDDNTLWDTLNSQTAIDWTINETKSFTVSSPASYQYYRVYITNAGGDEGYIGFAEIYMYESVSITDVLTVDPILCTISTDDTVTVEDVIGTVDISTTVSAEDTLTMTDELEVAPIELNTSVEDTITITDSSDQYITELFLSVSDNQSVSDSASIDPSLVSVYVSDTITTTDEVTVFIPTLYMSVEDTDSPTDEVDAIIPTLYFSTSDSLLTLSDALPHNCSGESLPGLCANITAGSWWRDAFYACDADTTYGISPSFWLSQAGLPEWWAIDFGTAKTINSYSILGFTATGPDKARTLTEWQLQGSNDNALWSVLDSHTAIDWTQDETKTFTIASPSVYQYYRVYITNAGGDETYIGFAEIYMYEGVGISDSVTVDPLLCTIATDDTVTTTDEVDVEVSVLTLYVDVEDSMTLSDTLTVDPLVYPISVDDTVTVTDSIDISIPSLYFTAEDTVTSSEELILSPIQISIFAEDTLTLSDSSQISPLAINIDVGDTLTMTDTAELNVPINVYAEDSIILSDYIYVYIHLEYEVIASDSISVSDSVSVKIPNLNTGFFDFMPR